MSTKIKYLEKNGQEIDHEPIVCDVGFKIPQRELFSLSTEKNGR